MRPSEQIPVYLCREVLELPGFRGRLTAFESKPFLLVRSLIRPR